MSNANNRYLPRDLDIDEILKKARSSATSSDVIGKALYDKYASKAAKDAVGKAAARTEGYGNSYAPIAGMKAYESVMSKANEAETVEEATEVTKLDSTAVNSWFQSVSAAGTKAYNYLTAGGYKQADTALIEEIDGYLESHEEVSRFLRANKASIKNYDELYQAYLDTVVALRSLRNNLQSSNRIFSQFESEDDYNRYTSGWLMEGAVSNAETVAARQGIYQSNKDRIAEIDKEIDSFGFTWLWGEERDKRNALEDEKERLEAENNKYDQRQGVVDRYFTPVTDEYLAISSNRNYTNASKDELWERDKIYDYLTDSTNNQYWKFDDSGNIIFELGNTRYTADDPLVAAIINENVDSYFETLIQDKLGMFLSASAEDRDEAYQRVTAIGSHGSDHWATTIQEGVNAAWGELTESEINHYYYLYNTQGQAAAYKYLEDMEVELTYRATVKRAEGYEDATALERIMQNAASVPMNVFGGVVALMSDAANAMEGKAYNPYSAGHAMSNDAAAIRQHTAMDIDKATGGASIPWLGFTVGDVYQSLMSRADSVFALYTLGGFGETVLGLNAARSTMKDVYERGGTKEQVISLGIIAGLAEAATEHFSLSELRAVKNLDKIAVKNLKDWVIRTLISAGIESSEEMASEAINMIFDTLIMGSQSNWSGVEDFVKNVVNAGLGGFISGATGGVSAGINYAQYSQAVSNHGQGIIDAGGTDALLTVSKEMAGDNKVVDKYSAKVEKKATAGNVGRLALAMQDAVTNKGSKVASGTKKTNSGKIEIQSIADVKSKVSDSGKTVNTSTGEVIAIDKGNAIAKIRYENGERVVYYNTDNGVVKSSDVVYASEDEGLIYESFVDLNPSFANAIIKNYDGKMPVENYIRGMREGVILYGMHNFQAVGKDIRSDTYFAELSEADQAFALKLGRAYAEADAKKVDGPLRTAAKKARESEADGKEASKGASAKKAAKKGKIRFENGAKAESKHKNVVALAKHLASALGIDIIFYDSTIPGTKYSDDNGFYDPNTDTIHLDLQKADSDNKIVAFTLSHELVHWLKKHSETAFNSFAKFLMEQYASHDIDTETLLKNKMTVLKTNDADFAYEEMICDACETLLLDSNAVVKLAELRRTDKSLFDKIKSFIRKLLDKIRGEYTRLGYDNNLSDEAKALLSMTDVLGEIYTKFEDAVVAAAENAELEQSIDTVEVSDTEAIKKQAKTKDSKIIVDVVPASNPYHSKTMYVDSEVYNYDFLTSLAPMKVETMPPLTAVKDNNKVSQDKAVRLGLANAERIGRRVTADKEQYAIINAYTQREIILGRKGLNHSLDASEIHRLRTNARLSAIGAYIVQNAVPINGLKKENQQANGTYAMACLLNDGPGYVVAIVTVDEFDSTVVGIDVVDSVHSINGRFLAKKEDSRSSSRESELGQESVSATAISNISIADFLEIVNSTHRSILSNDVLQHFNAERPSNGHYANRVLFQKKSASSRSILASALESTIDTSTQAGQIELEKLKEYQGKIALIELTEARLAEVKAEIHDISFTKGTERSKFSKLNEEKIKLQNRLLTYDRQLARLEALKPLQNLLARERDKAYKAAQQKGKDALDAYRDKMMAVQKEQIGQAREAKKMAVAKVRETRDNQEARKKLIKLVLETVSWITHPTKTDVRCPDMLKKPYKEFLESINLDSQRALKGDKLTKNDLRIDSAMNSLASVVERIRSEQVTEDGEVIGFLDLPENYVKILRDIAESIKDKMPAGYFVVNSMTSEELRQLIKLIDILNTSIKKMNALHANMRFANARELADTTISFLDSMGEAEKTNSLKDFVTWINALPYYAFKRFGEGGESIFEELMDAQDKMAFNAKTILDFKAKSWTDKEAREWGSDTHTILLPSGGSLTLTTADAMGIYCTARRDNGQGISHLTGGGVRVVGIKKGATKAKDSRANLTLVDIDEIIDSLTDRQKEVAEAIQSFMSTVCADWGNEISMKRFLTKDFTEKIYYPIESDNENHESQLPEASQGDLYRLLNISATKSLTKGANNRIVIRNIFDVFTSHTSDMARLNAFGMALLDYMKWLNYRERTVNAENGQVITRGVRQSMDTTYGEAARQYVMTLIKDINGRQSDDADNAFLMKMIRLGKTASVGNNLRVTFLQFTSYPRAAMVLSKSSLAKGLTKVPKIRMAEKYCGIALWKTFGFYDTNISRSIEDQIKGATNIRQKIIELSMAMPGMADALTWGALWNACEYEVAKTSENKVGSDEFYQQVGKKLREVVYATQVVDSVLTRSQIMRSKRGINQIGTAFMSEPTLTSNILMDAFFQFEKEKRITGSLKSAVKNTYKIIFKAVGNYCILQLLISLFESLADVWRDDDDEEFKEKFKEAFKETAITNFIPFNKLPIIADIAELVQSRFGVGYVSSDNMATTWIKHIADALDIWAEVIDEHRGGEETSKTVYNAIYATAKAISSVTGISVSGAMREVVALWNNTAGAYDITLKVRLYDPSNEELGNELYEAIIEGNERQADSIRGEFEDEDEMNAAIRKAMRTNDPRIKEAAQADIDGDVSEYHRIVNEMIAEGHFSEENIKGAIKAEINAFKGDEEKTENEDRKQSVYEAKHYYMAIVNGDTSLAGEIREAIIDTHIANGSDEEESEKAFNSSFRTCLRDEYNDGGLTRADAMDMLTEYGGMESDDAYWKLKEWDYYVANGSTDGYSKYNGFYEAVRTGANLKTVIKEYTDHGVEKSTLGSQITSYYKPIYRNMSNSERARIKGYILNAYVLLGYDRTDKSKDIDKWLED